MSPGRIVRSGSDGSVIIVRWTYGRLAALRTADRQVAVLTARQEEVVEGIADLERRLATARARLEKVTSELEEASGIRDEAESREARAAEALATDEAP